LNQFLVAVPRHLRQIAVGHCLLQARSQLGERALRLRDLMFDLRCRDLHQQVSGFDPVADIDGALGDIAAGPGIEIGLREGLRRSRPGGRPELFARMNRIRPDRRNEIAPLVGGRDHFGMHAVVLPETEAQRANEGQ